MPPLRLRLTRLVAIPLLALLAFPLDRAQLVANADAQPAEPLSLHLALPDGNTWVLGEHGVGKPFMARLLLDNRGKTPVTIWDYRNTEGSSAPGVTLTDAQGNSTILRPPPMERAAGVPTVITIQPTQVIAIELELLRLVGERDLPPGKYKLSAFNENKFKNASPFVKAEVWMGHIEAEPVEITIAGPK